MILFWIFFLHLFSGFFCPEKNQKNSGQKNQKNPDFKCSKNENKIGKKSDFLMDAAKNTIKEDPYYDLYLVPHQTTNFIKVDNLFA